MSISVLIADAQPLFSQVLSMTLARNDDFEVLEERPATGMEAVEMAISRRPEVVLLDFWMPDLSGPGAIETIRLWNPDPKIIVTSWLHGPEHIRAAVQAGATGFLPKTIDVDRVADAIRAAAGGESIVFSDELMGLLERMHHRRTARTDLLADLPQLSTREMQILGLLSLGRSPEEISKRLYIATGTVSNNIHRILAKLGVRSSAQAVTLATQAGLLRTSPTQDIQ